MLNTLYHIDASPGNIPYSLYEEMASKDENLADGKINPYHGLVQWAVPEAVGDSYKSRRIVATTTQFFGVDDHGNALPPDDIPEYGNGKTYSFAQGRAFVPDKFEAVIGSEVAQNAGLSVGSEFHATHGFPGPNDIPDVHAEIWKVVGVMNPTHTANDRCLFIPIKTFYAIFEHEEGLQQIGTIHAEAGTASAPASAPATAAAPEPEAKAYTMNPDGTMTVKLPKAEWEISAILVKSRSAATQFQLSFLLRNLPDAIGVSPANVMETFFDTFLPKITLLMFVISALVTFVAGVSILVSIYNSVTARNREIAIMRALGATRARILAAVCFEAGLIGTVGGILGLLGGHFLAFLGSVYLEQILSTGLPWWRFAPAELLYLPIVIAVSLLAGLVPALKAYSTPVAENLTG